MKEIEITNPHGVLLDGDGRVVTLFGNWEVGIQRVSEAVESVEYVSGPAAHERSVYWTYSGRAPPVGLSLGQQSIINDGNDTVDIRIVLNTDAESSRDVTLTVAGTEYAITLDPGVEEVETITSTQPPGSTIEIVVAGPDVQRATGVVEVVSA